MTLLFNSSQPSHRATPTAALLEAALAPSAGYIVCDAIHALAGLISFSSAGHRGFHTDLERLLGLAKKEDAIPGAGDGGQLRKGSGGGSALSAAVRARERKRERLR